MIAFALILASCANAPAPPSPSPTPAIFASPGTGGTCDANLPPGFTCVTGRTTTVSGGAAAGVCVNVGQVTNCPFYTDIDGNWRTQLPNGVEFIVTFWVKGEQKGRVDLTPSFLSGGVKTWQTNIPIEATP